MQEFKKLAKKKFGHGYQKRISEITKIHTNTIQTYFSGKTKITLERYKVLVNAVGREVGLLNSAKERFKEEVKYTGKVFECIGLEELEIKHWKEQFIIGKKYKGRTFSLDKKIIVVESDDAGLFYVDKSQFKEVIK